MSRSCCVTRHSIMANVVYPCTHKATTLESFLPFASSLSEWVPTLGRWWVGGRSFQQPYVHVSTILCPQENSQLNLWHSSFHAITQPKHAKDMGKQRYYVSFLCLLRPSSVTSCTQKAVAQFVAAMITALMHDCRIIVWWKISNTSSKIDVYIFVHPSSCVRDENNQDWIEIEELNESTIQMVARGKRAASQPASIPGQHVTSHW